MSTDEKEMQLLKIRGGNRQAVQEDVAEVPGSSVVVGVLVGLTGSRQPRVMFPGGESAEGITAQSTIRLRLNDIGRKVALLFDQGEISKPIVIGRIEIPDNVVRESSHVVKAHGDDDTLVFSADREITLKCGKASITLTRHGKILLRGCYISSRSSGTNRIRGATVHIN